MESELEGMLLGGWVQGDRAKLTLKVSELEKDLAIMTDRRQLDRAAFMSQKEDMIRRAAEMEHEAIRVTHELSLKAQGEEKLRKISQSRVKELEAKVILLGKQLQASEAKFRETDKALRRAGYCWSRHDSGDNYEHRLRQGGAMPIPADQPRRTSQDSDSAVNEINWFEKYFFPTVGSYYGPSVPGSKARCRDDGHSGADGTGDHEWRVSDSEVGGGMGDLSKAVEKLVAGLLQENMRLGSVVDQLQEQSTSAFLSHVPRAPTASVKGIGEQKRQGQEKGAPEADLGNEHVGHIATRTAAADVACVDEVVPWLATKCCRCPAADAGLESHTWEKAPCAVKNEQKIPYHDAAHRLARLSQDLDREPPVANSLSRNERESNRLDPPVRAKTAGREEPGISERCCLVGLSEWARYGTFLADSATEGGTTDVAAALSKVQALIGMVRAQEEIEALLGHEVAELRKKAKHRERLWRLIIRWKDELEARNYPAERDIR